jgi:hypothetical protein
MNKLSTIWRIAIVLAVLILVGITIRLSYSEEDYRSPGSFHRYPDSGYYEIDPDTILDSLEHGETDVFTPFFGDPDRDEPYYTSIAWTQADYLKIADALSQEIWGEALDLESWNVKYLFLSQGCEDDLRGFNTFTIVYYKPRGIVNLERRYTTRLIDMYPWQGLIRWGGNGDFSAPQLRGSRRIDMNKVKITAEDAIEIAEKNGGQNIRLRNDNNCLVNVSINHIHQQNDDNRLVDYDRTPFYMKVNSFDGQYKLLSPGQ